MSLVRKNTKNVQYEIKLIAGVFQLKDNFPFINLALNYIL